MSLGAGAPRVQTEGLGRKRCGDSAAWPSWAHSTEHWSAAVMFDITGAGFILAAAGLASAAIRGS